MSGLTPFGIIVTTDGGKGDHFVLEFNLSSTYPIYQLPNRQTDRNRPRTLVKLHALAIMPRAFRLTIGVMLTVYARIRFV
jgi:hypothetical protein